KASFYPLRPNIAEFEPASNVKAVLNGEDILFTYGLKPFKTYDLLGISQHGSLLSKGLVDPTDCLDPDVSVDALIINNGFTEMELLTREFDKTRFLATRLEDGNHRELGFTETLILPIMFGEACFVKL